VAYKQKNWKSLHEPVKSPKLDSKKGADTLHSLTIRRIFAIFSAVMVALQPLGGISLRLEPRGRDLTWPYGRLAASACGWSRVERI
jgi:hypothetical protein